MPEDQEDRGMPIELWMVRHGCVPDDTTALARAALRQEEEEKKMILEFYKQHPVPKYGAAGGIIIVRVPESAPRVLTKSVDKRK